MSIDLVSVWVEATIVTDVFIKVYEKSFWVNSEANKSVVLNQERT